MKKQLALALTAGVAATGAVVASAATLGGVNAKSLGADTAVIASCDTHGGVNADYTTAYDGTRTDPSSTSSGQGTYLVQKVTLSNVDDACVGKTVNVTLADATGAPLVQLTGTVAGPAGTANANTVDLAVPTGASAPVVYASKVGHIAVVISG